jgi:co-chaperonin GroES (HSP10)
MDEVFRSNFGIELKEVRETRTDKYNHFNHKGEVVATPDGAHVGKTVWFKHTLAMNLEDSRDYEPDGFNENHWRFINGDKDVEFFRKNQENIRYYPATQSDFESTVVCSDEGGEIGLMNNFIPYFQGEKHTEKNGLVLVNKQSWEEGVGFTAIEAYGIPKGSRLYYWKNSGFPHENDQSKWIKKDGKRVCFVKKEDVFGWDVNGEFILNEGWNIIKCEDSDDWEEANGIWIPRKMKKQEGWGNVVMSDRMNVGDRVFFLKRAYFSLVLNDEIHFAVKHEDIIVKEDVLKTISQRQDKKNEV